LALALCEYGRLYRPDRPLPNALGGFGHLLISVTPILLDVSHNPTKLQPLPSPAIPKSITASLLQQLSALFEI
jgi:hypothetical protein